MDASGAPAFKPYGSVTSTIAQETSTAAIPTTAATTTTVASTTEAVPQAGYALPKQHKGPRMSVHERTFKPSGSRPRAHKTTPSFVPTTTVASATVATSPAGYGVPQV